MFRRYFFLTLLLAGAIIPLQASEAPLVVGKDRLDVELGFLAAQGNARHLTFTGKIDADQHFRKWLNTYKATFRYRKNNLQQGDNNTTRAYFSAQMNRRFTTADERLFLFADYEVDKKDPYRYQTSFAIGWSTYLWRIDEHYLRYNIGPGYALSPGEEGQKDGVNGVILRSALDYKVILNDRVSFTQYINSESNSERLKMRADSAVGVKVSESLAMKLSLDMRYNDSPAPGLKKLDSTISCTLVYQFF